jgi:hypothetical protein
LLADVGWADEIEGLACGESCLQVQAQGQTRLMRVSWFACLSSKGADKAERIVLLAGLPSEEADKAKGSVCEAKKAANL